MKACTNCDRPNRRFAKDSRRTDGLKSWCSDCVTEHARAFRKTHKSYRTANARWAASHKDQRAAYKKRERDKVRLEVLLHYSEGTLTCQCCREGNVEFLTIDHIDGGGREHRREIYCATYRWLRTNGYPSGYRVLCMNCNFSIGVRGYCPHQRSKTHAA